MKRSVSVKLGSLAQATLFRGDFDSPTLASSRLERAIRCYLGDRSSGREEWPYPRFLDGMAGEQAEVELLIDEGLWSGLRQEADRQRLPVERLAEHATLYYAADLEAGRITQRILENLDDEEPGPTRYS